MLFRFSTAAGFGVCRLLVAVMFCFVAVLVSQGSAANDRVTEIVAIDVDDLVSRFDESMVVGKQSDSKRSGFGTMPHHVAVPADCEAYVALPERQKSGYAGYRVLIKRPVGKPFAGSVFLKHKTRAGASVLAEFKFIVNAKAVVVDNDYDFLKAKGEHYTDLWSKDYVGAAWFRHRAHAALSEIHEKLPKRNRASSRRESSQTPTMDMFSGGRAVSENLQLNRPLGDSNDRGKKEAQRSVALSTVPGITIDEIDWTERMAKADPEFDPLARIIPHDQYAVFVPSFSAIESLIDRGNRYALAANRIAEPAATTVDFAQFYQRQLGLEMNQVARFVGRALIDQIAITGSDPYFQTGTDVAVVMQSSDAKTLYKTLRLKLDQNNKADIKDVTISGQPVHAVVTFDRRVSAQLCRLGDVVVVANSAEQMRRIVMTSDKRKKSMRSLDEYRFFRQRYPKQTPDETAFVVITDSAIRKWCSPQWRIAASRRTVARSAIADATAAHAGALVNETVEVVAKIPKSSDSAKIKDMKLTSSGVHSKRFGTLAFQTPIAELNVRSATPREVELYNTWRDRYMGIWRGKFDPIAVQITMTDDQLAADVSVIPLRLGSSYGSISFLAGDTNLGGFGKAVGAGSIFVDNSEATVGGIVQAVSAESGFIAIANGMVKNQGINGANLDWVKTVEVTVEIDTEWVTRVNESATLEDEINQWTWSPPIKLLFPSTDKAQMESTLAAIRKIVSAFMRDRVQWKRAEHEGVEYGISELPGFSGADQPKQYLYSFVSDVGLVISPNERVIHRAIRQNEKRQLADQPDQSSRPDQAEIVDEQDEQLLDPTTFHPQLAFAVKPSRAMLNVFGASRQTQELQRELAWSNLHVMNDLRKRFPERSPDNVYFKLFGERLVEPSGGKYRWNESLQTYESTLYGSPWKPRFHPVLNLPINEGEEIRGALTVANNEFRGKLIVSGAAAQ